MTGSVEWFVRKADGTEFGPAPISELAAWARDGRIAPDDAVSTDRAAWQPAPEIPELDMNWLVETEPGLFYGPAHARAFVEMMREGALRGETRVRHARTGEETHLNLLAARLEASAHTEALLSSVRAAPADAEAIEATAPERTVSWKSMAMEKDRFEQEATHWKRLYDEDQSRLAELEKKLLESTRTLERERISHHAAMEQAALEIEALHRATALRQASEGSDTLDAAYTEFSRGFEALGREQEKKNAELAELRKKVVEMRKGYEDRIALMEDHIRREQSAADQANARLAEVERAHADMVAMVRDLNDRYIRLREQQANPTAATAPETAARPKVRMTR